MFTDIKTSRDGMQSFKQHQANAASTSGVADDIDLAVQVWRPSLRLQRKPRRCSQHSDSRIRSEQCLKSCGASSDSVPTLLLACSCSSSSKLTRPGAQVLTTGSWPTQTAAKCNLPRELEQCCKSFQDYYLKAHSGRKLSWQTNMGNADLKARFAAGMSNLQPQQCIYQRYAVVSRTVSATPSSITACRLRGIRIAYGLGSRAGKFQREAPRA